MNFGWHINPDVAKAGGLQILVLCLPRQRRVCQVPALVDYGCAIGAFELEPSGFGNTGVDFGACAHTLTPPGTGITSMEGFTVCGRFVGFRKLEELRQYFPIDASNCEAAANFNVAPSQEVLAIVRVDGANVLDKYHWGLVPFWAKDTRIGYRMINARSETVAGKPSFREAYKKRRCLILADGFYEWKGQKGEKQPMFVTLPDRTPFAFAGLWEIWRDKKNPDDVYQSCTIITCDAVGPMRELHHRMPVILDPTAYGPWLDPDFRDPDALNAILQGNALTELIFHPVAKQVNAVRNNDPSNIEPAHY